MAKMRGAFSQRLTKPVQGYFWAGSGPHWMKTERYGKVDDKKLVSAFLGGTKAKGSFKLRFNGTTLSVTVRSQKGTVVSRFSFALPGARSVR